MTTKSAARRVANRPVKPAKVAAPAKALEKARCPGCGSTQFTQPHPPRAPKPSRAARLAIPVGGAFRPMQTCKVCGWTVEVSA